MNLFSYFDSQVFGIGAIFNMVQDLKLYDLISLDPLILDLTKYSWAAALPNFGALLVSQLPFPAWTTSLMTIFSRSTQSCTLLNGSQLAR